MSLTVLVGRQRERKRIGCGSPRRRLARSVGEGQERAMIRLLPFVLLLSLACGGSSAETVDHAHHDHGHGGETADDHHHHHHHDDAEAPPALRAFHAAFREAWHSDRSGATVCPGATDLQDAAEAAVEESAEAHPEVTARVSATADAFVAACQAEPEGGERFDAAFSAFHDAFHELLDAAR